MGFDLYLRTQAELGGDEVVLSEPRYPRLSDLPDVQPQSQPNTPRQATPATPLKLEGNFAANDGLWKTAANIDDFYSALQKHSVYTKSMRSLSFYIPKERKTNVPFFLIFHSPQELTTEARGILERLFKKLNIDLNACAISFFFKCNEIALPREKPILREMLCKEIEFINPKKIVFFREAPRPEKTEPPAKVGGEPIMFAGKPAITLYSLLEILPGKPEVKEKMSEVLNICQAQLSR